jgi:hypothetical protein
MSGLAGFPPLPEDGGRFIVLFARFEFAARRAGWHRGSEPLIAWGKVASAFTPAFLDAARPIASYLISSPPKDLTLVNGGWCFALQPEPITSTVDLFKAVAQVRNNFLHGEKPYWSERDKKLIADATAVLERAYAWAQEHDLPIAVHIHESFGGGTP